MPFSLSLAVMVWRTAAVAINDALARLAPEPGHRQRVGRCCVILSRRPADNSRLNSPPR